MASVIPLWPNEGRFETPGSKAPRQTVAIKKFCKQTQLSQRVSSPIGNAEAAVATVVVIL
jgi:hypothetical protein